MPTHRIAGALVGVIALAGPLGACGSGDGDGDGATEAAGPATAPVIESAAGAPGTPLGDGFAVVEGTTLVGDPIPLDRGGWTATSIVDGGDPVEVVGAYLAQAEEAGLDVQRPAGCAPDQDVVVCSGFARSPDRAEPRSVSAAVVRGPRDDVLSDHVVVRYSTDDLYWDYGDVGTGGDPDMATSPPASWPALPAAGESLGTAGETQAVLVEEGSRPAAPTRLNLDDATGGIVAVLEVTGEPRSVLQAYADQLSGRELEVHVTEEPPVGDAIVLTLRADQAGGDHFTLTLVERPDRPVWLHVAGSHD